MVWVCSAAEKEALTKTAMSHCVAISGHDKASYTRCLHTQYLHRLLFALLAC